MKEKEAETKLITKFELSVPQEEYLQIYHEFFVLKWNWTDIALYHECSKSKVTTALEWVIKNRLEIPSKNLIKGAIDALLVRLKSNQEMYDTEIKKKRYRDNMFVISLTREIREDEKTLYKLQEVYNDEDSNKDTPTTVQVLQLITGATKIETLSKESGSKKIKKVSRIIKGDETVSENF